ncbi:MAG: hypothetical protein J6T55_03510 [Alphaproteobacteria bacterium]|nr:hypothetical protein [Alphaproteobacteria bacterium]
MFSRLKKNRTLRSLLGAASLFVAGAPAVAEVAPKEPLKITQKEQSQCDALIKEYMPLCEQLEGNLPYCYYGKTGNMTVGCGVHFKDFKELDNLTALKVTPKKGHVFSLENKERLFKIANADWTSPNTSFKEVASVEIISLKACGGNCPKNTDKKWRNSIILMPSKTLDKINKTAAEFFVKNAYEHHRNLFQLPPSVRLVIVDLMYNLGVGQYKKTYPKFQDAINRGDLWEARKQCKTNNERRDNTKQFLFDSALLSKDRYLSGSPDKVCRELRTLVGKKKNICVTTAKEPLLWLVIDSCTKGNHSWYMCQSKTHWAMVAGKKFSE